MKSTFTIWLGLAAAAIASSGCTSPRCKTDGDCFVPEVCVDRRCEIVDEQTDEPADDGVEPITDAGLDADEAADDGPALDSEPAVSEMGSGPPDDGVAVDLGVDMVVDEDMAIGSNCVVDPFTFICDEDRFEPNNEFATAARVPAQTQGCALDFEPSEQTVDAVLCPIDSEDWYQVMYSPCDERAFVIEWQLEVEGACTADDVEFKPYLVDCADDLVDCSVEDGKPTIRKIVPAGLVGINAFRVIVRPTSDDLAIDYNLRVEVR